MIKGQEECMEGGLMVIVPTAFIGLALIIDRADNKVMANLEFAGFHVSQGRNQNPILHSKYPFLNFS